MIFPSGYIVVHKAHGVGEIQGVEELAMGGEAQDYYIMKIVASGLTVRFPKATSAVVVRELASVQEISSIYTMLREPPLPTSEVWNRRKRLYSDKMRTGSLLDIAEVLRDLHARRCQRQPSPGEKELAVAARARLVSEIAVVKSCSTQAIEAELTQALCAVN